MLASFLFPLTRLAQVRTLLRFLSLSIYSSEKVINGFSSNSLIRQSERAREMKRSLLFSSLFCVCINRPKVAVLTHLCPSSFPPLGIIRITRSVKSGGKTRKGQGAEPNLAILNRSCKVLLLEVSHENRPRMNAICNEKQRGFCSFPLEVHKRGSSKWLSARLLFIFIFLFCALRGPFYDVWTHLEENVCCEWAERFRVERKEESG